MSQSRILAGQYTQVRYRQFAPGPLLRALRALLGWLCWPLALPAAGLSRLSDDLFRTFSEAFSLVPYVFGVILRYEFYRFALRRCGRNVIVEFGTVFLYRDVSVGSHVNVARNVIVHHCDLGDYVLVGEGSSLLSGSRYHGFQRTDLPMVLQGGAKTRIRIGEDCWIGARSVVMADVGRGSIVGAGSVVTRGVQPYSIAAGNPARLLRRRGEKPPAEGPERS
jgi:acetyltransferase-like isoleucine patch superfamily enzyme